MCTCDHSDILFEGIKPPSAGGRGGAANRCPFDSCFLGGVRHSSSCCWTGANTHIHTHTHTHRWELLYPGKITKSNLRLQLADMKHDKNNPNPKAFTFHTYTLSLSVLSRGQCGGSRTLLSRRSCCETSWDTRPPRASRSPGGYPVTVVTAGQE